METNHVRGLYPRRLKHLLYHQGCIHKNLQIRYPLIKCNMLLFLVLNLLTVTIHDSLNSNRAARAYNKTINSILYSVFKEQYNKDGLVHPCFRKSQREFFWLSGDAEALVGNPNFTYGLIAVSSEPEMIQLLRYYDVDEDEIRPTENQRCAAALVGARLPRIGDIYDLADKVEHLTTITVRTERRVEEIGEQLKNFKAEFKEEMQNGMKTIFDEYIRNLKLIHKDQDEQGRAMISGKKILCFFNCCRICS